MTLEQLTELFGWMTIINVGIFMVSSVLIMALKNVVGKMHAKMFGIQQQNVAAVMYGYLGLFKILLILFNFVPYIALKIIL